MEPRCKLLVITKFNGTEQIDAARSSRLNSAAQPRSPVCQDRLQVTDHAALEIINMLCCYSAWNLREARARMFAASRRLWLWSSHHPLGYLTLACWASSTWLLSSVVIFLVIFLLEELDQPWKNKATRSRALPLAAQDDTGSYKPEEGPADQEAVMSPSDRARKIRNPFFVRPQQEKRELSTDCRGNQWTAKVAWWKLRNTSTKPGKEHC